MLVPEFLDFVIAENEATAIARRLNTPSRGWDGLLSVAQALVTRFQDLPENASTSPESFLDYAQVSPIVAAARIFDTFAAFEREEPLEERRDQCLHAAVCYAMYGNFPAATAVISRLNALEHATPGLLPIIAVCCPRLIGQCLNSSHVTDASVAFLTLLNSVLLGQLSSLHELESVLGACFDLCEDDFEITSAIFSCSATTGCSIGNNASPTFGQHRRQRNPSRCCRWNDHITATAI